MPSRNVVKPYVKNSYYHLYNRGVEKRIIFKDKADYKVFLSYLKNYLSPPVDISQLRETTNIKDPNLIVLAKSLKNYCKEISLLAYCLMPNHFHLLIKQKERTSVASFMGSLGTRYTMYFNKRHKRIGTLFQGTYKAAIVKKDEYLVHLSRYIHINPMKRNRSLVNSYSSYADYLRLRNTSWVNPKPVLDFFRREKIFGLKRTNTYKYFVEKHISDYAALLGNLVLEN